MADRHITALALRGSAAQWTTLREKKGAWDLSGSVDVAIPLPAGVTELVSPDGLAPFKAKTSSIKGQLSWALPTEQALLRVVQLPSTDPAELRSMAELQVDKFCPFPLEHMLVGIEVLAQTETSSRVLVAAVQRDRVEKAGDFLKKAGHPPARVDIEVLGWWQLLQQAKAVPEHGRHAVVLIDRASTELVVVQDGVPVLFRSLVPAGGASDEERATELAEEINYTLTTLEAEWGALTTTHLQVWHWDTLGEEFLRILGGQCMLDVKAHHLEALPPLTEGLARRVAAPAVVAMDLSPAEWGAALQGFREQRIVIRAVIALVALWLVALGIAFALVEVQNRSFDQVKREAAQLAGPAGQVAAIRDQVEALEKYSDRTDSALECLREVSERLPSGIDLSGFVYRKYSELNLRGEAGSSDPVYEFFQRLEDSALFTEVKPEGVTDENRGGVRRSVFKVTCMLPVPEGLGGEEQE